MALIFLFSFTFWKQNQLTWDSSGHSDFKGSFVFWKFCEIFFMKQTRGSHVSFLKGKLYVFKEIVQNFGKLCVKKFFGAFAVSFSGRKVWLQFNNLITIERDRKMLITFRFMFSSVEFNKVYYCKQFLLLFSVSKAADSFGVSKFCENKPCLSS